MELKPSTSDISNIMALAVEEDAWCCHEKDIPGPAWFIHEWLQHHRVMFSASGNPLADEEDAWARA